MTISKSAFDIVAWAFVALTLVVSAEHRDASLVKAGFTGSGESKTMKLVAEHKRDSLLDISSDGRLLLFYQSSAPMRSFSFPVGGGRGKAAQPEAYDDILRAVERESGREISRTGVRFYPFHEQFIPGTHQVFYSEPKPDPETTELYKLWDPTSGQRRTCLDGPDETLSSLVFLDQQHALGVGRTVRQRDAFSGDQLLSLTLPDCRLAPIGPVDPDNPKARIPMPLALSSDHKSLAYVVTDGKAFVWDVRKGRVAKSFDSAPLFFRGAMAYTLDGKFLLIGAGTYPFAGGQGANYILFYNAVTYEQVRRLQIPGDATAIAVSLDSQMLAVAYTDRQEAHGLFSPATEQGVVLLYNVVTGEELARASHPSVKQNHNDPFLALINRLAFTPDRKYLLSSTYDTRVWEIEDATTNR